MSSLQRICRPAVHCVVIRATVLIGGSRAGRGMWHVDIHLATIFFGHKPALGAVANDTRRNQNDQFGLLNIIVPVGECHAKPGNVTEYRYLFAGLAGLFLNHAAERQHLAIVDHDGGLDAPLLDGRRVDAEVVVFTTALTSCSISSCTRPLSLMRGSPKGSPRYPAL